jgi:transcriptional antiterminator RfaH
MSSWARVMVNTSNLAQTTEEPVDLHAGERWFAVHTLRFGEMRAQAQLENQRFRTFLPKRHKTVRHARRLTTVVAPFFPQYLFVVLDLQRHQWRSINGTFGVTCLVMQGDRPAPVPRGIVEKMLASADPRGMLHIGSESLKTGDRVRLTVGPFAEQLAVLDRMDDSRRIRVLLDMLGRQVAVSIDANSALPAG